MKFWQVVFVYLLSMSYFCIYPILAETAIEEKPWQAPEKKMFTPKERRQECRKYQGQFISYYGKIYKVVNCQRREVSYEQVNTMFQSSRKIISVEGDTMIKIEKGEPLSAVKKRIRPCTFFNGEYISHGSGEIYFIKNCHRQGFPDWETYTHHRKKNFKNTFPVLDISQEEYNGFKESEIAESIFASKYKDFSSGGKEVMVIPLVEACQGLNGKLVSYYSQFYRIQNCRKRKILDSTAIRKRLSELAIIEISSEKWISIPEGEPIPDTSK